MLVKFEFFFTDFLCKKVIRFLFRVNKIFWYGGKKNIAPPLKLKWSVHNLSNDT